MKRVASPWLLLISNLPGKNQTSRMRTWRALKASGAGLLRDGVYVLPNTTATQKIFEEQSLGIATVGGSAHILRFESDSPEQQETLIGLFDRTPGYVELQDRLNDFRRTLDRTAEPQARKALAAIAREAVTLSAVDFFPGSAQEQIRGALSGAEAALNRRFSPDEPRPVHRRIPRRDRKKFRGRLWATRQHLWIDRVCSAWLIRRFIDPKAQFIWLKRIQDKPKRAIGFDFDGAEFSHVGSKVTFEVMLQSFGLESDTGLTRLGALVHFLDVGGIPVEEAPGLAAIVSGARALAPDDDALLRAVTVTLDSLYQSYGTG
jgi:hypothetical protein